MRTIYIIFIFLLYYNPAYAIQQQDCDVMRYESGNISFGFKAGGFGWGVGPEISFGSQSGTKWNDNLQFMVAEYQELCSRYNTGRMSKVEYDKEIQLIIQRSRNYIIKMDKIFREKKENLFSELEREVSQ